MAHVDSWQAGSGCLQEAPVLYHVDLFIELLEYPNNKAAGSPDTECSKTEEGGSCNAVHDLIPEVTLLFT
jgi:hypothetical protein